MNAEIVTTIITGAVTIIAAVIAFAGGCKSGNNVTKEAKSELKLEHKDLKDALQLEHKDIKDTLQSDLTYKIVNSQNSIESTINTVKEIINIEIAKSEERKKYLTPEQVTMNQVAEQIKNMHSNWLEANAKIDLLEKEKISLNKRIKELENENTMLKNSLKQSRSERSVITENENNIIIETQSEEDNSCEPIM